MVMGFADQQQNAEAVIGLFLQQANRVANRIKNASASVSGLQVHKIGIDEGLIAREISRQVYLTIEFDDSDPRGAQGEQGTEHRLQPLHAGEFLRRAAAFLNGNHQGDGLRLGRFIESD